MCCSDGSACGRARGYADTLRKEGADARGFPVDAGDFDSLAGALGKIDQELGAPEVLVYNAAVLRRGSPTSLSGDDLLADFRVNVAGALVCARHVAAAMRERKRGTILLTGGGLALSPHPDFASLAVGKAGIRSLAGREGAGPNLAPPGWYLLFLLNGSMTPSEGRWIRVTP